MAPYKPTKHPKNTAKIFRDLDDDGDVARSQFHFLQDVWDFWESLGKAGIAGNLTNGIGFGSSEFYVLRPTDRVLPQWIYYCVTHETFRSRAIPQMTGTGGLQRVPKKFVEQFEIPLPPLEVQRTFIAEIEKYQGEIKRLQVDIAEKKKEIRETVTRVWEEGLL